MPHHVAQSCVTFLSHMGHDATSFLPNKAGIGCAGVAGDKLTLNYHGQGHCVSGISYKMSFFGTPSTSAPVTTTPAEKDIEVPEPPSDSISSLAFSPVADYLAVGSWDNNVSGLLSWVDAPVLIINIRFESMKWVPMGRHRGRRCMGTRDQY